jgi:hypothetical protein
LTFRLFKRFFVRLGPVVSGLTGAPVAHEARCRNVSAAPRITVARPMKGTLDQKKAIKAVEGKRLDAGSRRQASSQDDQAPHRPF